jgi:hypothetical protein
MPLGRFGVRITFERNNPLDMYLGSLYVEWPIARNFLRKRVQHTESGIYSISVKEAEFETLIPVFQ